MTQKLSPKSNGKVPLIESIPQKQHINGLLYTLLKRNTSHALYEVTDFDKKHIHSYELHQIRVKEFIESNIIFKNGKIAHFKGGIREVLASNEEFGEFAKCLKPDLNYALKRFEATN